MRVKQADHKRQCAAGPTRGSATGAAAHVHVLLAGWHGVANAAEHMHKEGQLFVPNKLIQRE